MWDGTVIKPVYEGKLSEHAVLFNVWQQRGVFGNYFVSSVVFMRFFLYRQHSDCMAGEHCTQSKLGVYVFLGFSNINISFFVDPGNRKSVPLYTYSSVHRTFNERMCGYAVFDGSTVGIVRSQD